MTVGKKTKAITKGEQKRIKFIQGVTWVLVITFLITCVGFAVIGRGKRESSTNQQDKPVSDDQKFSEEIKYWNEQIKENEKDPLSWGNLGYQYQIRAITMLKNDGSVEGMKKAKGPLQEAIKAYQKALELDPDYTFAMQHLAESYLFTGEYDKAKKYWEEALKRDPENVKYHLGIAKIYFAEEKYNDVVKKIDEVLKLDPTMLEAYQYKSQSFLLMNKNEEAKKALLSGKEIAMQMGDQENAKRFEVLIESIDKNTNKPSKTQTQEQKNSTNTEKSETNIPNKSNTGEEQNATEPQEPK